MHASGTIIENSSVPSTLPGPAPGSGPRSLYARTIALAHRPGARWALAGVSFAESSVFPIPPDALLIPMVLADRARAWTLAAICTAASVLGGLLGYAIGYFLFDAIGQHILALYGYGGDFSDFTRRYNLYGAWIVLFAGVTPFPYKIVTISSGVAGLDLGIFILCSLAGRGARFLAEAALLWRFGPPIGDFVEKRMGLLAAGLLVLIAAGAAIIAWL